jgi:hypothetical protein
MGRSDGGLRCLGAELPEAERATWLRGMAATDSDLHARVESRRQPRSESGSTKFVPRPLAMGTLGGPHTGSHRC